MKTDMKVITCFCAKLVYAEQDFSLKNATSQTEKDFRFRTSYLEISGEFHRSIFTEGQITSQNKVRDFYDFEIT